LEDNSTKHDLAAPVRTLLSIGHGSHGASDRLNSESEEIT
jgi:hypothetical protein